MKSIKHYIVVGFLATTGLMLASDAPFSGVNSSILDGEATVHIGQPVIPASITSNRTAMQVSKWSDVICSRLSKGWDMCTQAAITGSQWLTEAKKAATGALQHLSKNPYVSNAREHIDSSTVVALGAGIATYPVVKSAIRKSGFIPKLGLLAIAAIGGRALGALSNDFSINSSIAGAFALGGIGAAVIDATMSSSKKIEKANK